MQGIELKYSKIGVGHFHQTCLNLGFDADHEAIYVMGQFLSLEECNEFSQTW